MNVTASIIYFLKGLLALYSNLSTEDSEPSDQLKDNGITPVDVKPIQTTGQIYKEIHWLGQAPEINVPINGGSWILEQDPEFYEQHEGYGIMHNGVKILYGRGRTREPLYQRMFGSHKNWKFVNDDTCGLSNTNRIIGGKAAQLGQFPWIVRLGYLDENNSIKYMCGGSILNRRYVITASHCIFNSQFPLNHIAAGEYDERTDIDCEDKMCAPKVQKIGVEEIIMHPKYNRRNFKNDVALLRLENRIKFNDFVRPICLTTGKYDEKDLVGKTFEVAGWGIYQINSEIQSPILLYVNLKDVPMSRCLQKFSAQNPGAGQLCVGGKKGKDSCGGDSGGPLMMPGYLKGASRMILVGLVSYGVTSCAMFDIPAVYTDLKYYLDFILDNIRGN